MGLQYIAIYATDTIADWEYSYLTAYVENFNQMKPGHLHILWVGDGLAPVHSLGGMEVTPTADLDELDNLPVAALMIPGGDTYHAGHERLLGSVEKLMARQIPVAAICGGTTVLARAGVLNDRKHTSNAPEFLQADEYTGAAHYVEAPAVTDQGVITAGGIHAVPFTAAIMRAVGFAPEPVIANWEKLFTSGNRQFFTKFSEAMVAWLHTEP